MFRSNIPPENLPAGWQASQLRHIASIHGGGRLGLTKANYVDAGVAAYSAAGQDGFVDVVEGVVASIILSSIGARCGKSFLTDGPWATLANTQVITPDPTLAEASFLIGLLDDEEYWNRSGSAQPFIKPSDIKAAWVPLPPLDEQRRIAEVLRSVDEAIAAQSGVCAHLRQTTDDLADELYAREIAHDDANLTAYGEACETVQVGIVVKPASYYVDDGGVPALRSTNIKRNEIDFSRLVQLSSAGHEFNRKSSLRAGDVVTIRTGEPGKTAVIPDDAPSPLNCIDIIFSRPKPQLRPAFASYFINSSTARRQIAAMQGGLAQQHFNVGEMKKLHLPVPSLVRQERVVEVLDGAWLSVRLEEAQLATLRSTKTVLMSDLLSGRVRVPT